VHGCLRGPIEVPLASAYGERITGVQVRRNGYRVAVRRRGGAVRVAWGSAATARVFVSETVRVGAQREHVRFTRIYTRCS
jgi:hypothetical protein